MPQKAKQNRTIACLYKLQIRKVKMLEKIKTNVKCDVWNCKNTAEYYLVCKGKLKRVCLCKECVSKIANSQATTPPKSPQNAIKRKIEQKQKRKS